MWTNKLDRLMQMGSREAKLVRFLNPSDNEQINFWKHLRKMQWNLKVVESKLIHGTRLFAHLLLALPIALDSRHLRHFQTASTPCEQRSDNQKWFPNTKYMVLKHSSDAAQELNWWNKESRFLVIPDSAHTVCPPTLHEHKNLCKRFCLRGNEIGHEMSS